MMFIWLPSWETELPLTVKSHHQDSLKNISNMHTSHSVCLTRGSSFICPTVVFSWHHHHGEVGLSLYLSSFFSGWGVFCLTHCLTSRWCEVNSSWSLSAGSFMCRSPFSSLFLRELKFPAEDWSFMAVFWPWEVDWSNSDSGEPVV